MENMNFQKNRRQAWNLLLRKLHGEKIVNNRRVKVTPESIASRMIKVANAPNLNKKFTRRHTCHRHQDI